MPNFISQSEKNPYSEFCEVFLLYHDEKHGQFPFFMYPHGLIKKDVEKMRLINTHYIWMMDIREQAVIDHINLGYKNKVFLARKFITLSKKRRSQEGPAYDCFETIVIILAIPTEISLYGGDLLIEMTTEIIKNFEGKLDIIIESEKAKEEIIKTPKIKEIIKNGDILKNKLNILIDNISKDFFSSIIKQIDTKSIELQKAISFFALKGINIADIDFNKKKSVFNFLTKPDEILELKAPLSISKINIADNGIEVEIIVQNNTEEDLNNTIIKISYLKGFLEKEIMNQIIDIWFPYEELLFNFPIILDINDYILIINRNEELMLSKKIDLITLKKN